MAVSEQQVRQRDSRPRKALTIGAVCKILQSEFDDVSISKIRYLEDQKLLTPRRTPGRLPPLQPVRRRTAAHDPAPAARRVPAAAGDPPGAGGGRRHRRRRRRLGQATLGRRRAAGDPGRHLARLPDPRRGDRGDRRARGADRRAGELRHRAARETRRQDRLRRDRPRSDPRRQRALPLRRRRPQPARLPLLGRPRGEPAGSAARAVAALAQPRSSQGGAREPREPGGDGQPPQAPLAVLASPRGIACRSASSSLATEHATLCVRQTGPRAQSDAGNEETISAAPGEVWELVSDPYSLPRWWPRTMRVESVEGEGAGAQWTKVLGTAEGRGVRADFRCDESVEGERYGWEQQIAGTPFERHLRRYASRDRPARTRARAPRCR